MSRIGKMPIDIPAGVDVSIDGTTVSTKGKLGELTLDLPAGIGASVVENRIELSRSDDTRESKSFHGLARSLVFNMVEGVVNGYSRDLEINGVGFRATASGRELTMTLGFSSPVEYEAPEGVTIEVTDGTKIKVSGSDKQKVGQAAARIRAFCPAEPYKGKGVQYKGERIRRKVGKTVA